MAPRPAAPPAGPPAGPTRQAAAPATTATTTTTATTAAPERPAPGGGQRAGGRGWVVPLSVLIIGMFMSVLDTSIVNVAIPKMQTALNASVDNIEWVVTGYTLALGVIVPLTGWLGLRLGLTRLYVGSMVGFALGSALCGLAWNLNSMIAFRILQAIPGGVLPVVTMTLLYQIVPREKIGTAMGLYGLGVVVAPAVGPTLGGYLVEYFDWRLIFFINVPVGVLGTVLALVVLPQIKPTTWPRLDVWGFVTIAYALFAMLLAFSEGQDWGWTGYRVLTLFATSLLSLMLFLVIENEVDNPLINLKVFRSFPFCVSLVLLGITVTGLFSALYFLPQFLQQVQGLQELDSGLVLMPGALVLVVLMPIAGRIYDAIGPRYPAMAGLAFLALGSYLLAQITVDTPRGDVELWLGVRNLGVGLCMMPIITAGVSALPGSLTAVGSSVNNVMQRVASSIAIAVFGSLNVSKGAQLIASQSALAGADSSSAAPGVATSGAGGAVAGSTGQVSQLLEQYQALSARVTTETYANGFFVVAILAAVGVVLAVFMRSGRRSAGGGERGPVEV